MPSIQRIYGFDCIRVLAALLGLVLHSALPYANIHHTLPWPVISQTQSVALNMLVIFIHLFRMPLFFCMLGFFAYVVKRKYGLYALTLHRFKRIVIPFLIFWLGPLLLELGMDTLFHTKSTFLISAHYTYGLWFLYFAIVMYAITIVLSALLKPIETQLKQLCLPKVRLLCLFVILFGCVLSYQLIAHISWITPTSFEMRIHWPIFLDYFLFFMAGWCFGVYQTLWQLILSKSAWWLSACGLALFFGFSYLYISDYHAPHAMLWGAILYHLSGWAFSLGLIGLALRYLTRTHRVTRYLADSSYWIYLSQFQIIFITQFILRFSKGSLYMKFGIVLVVSTVFCLLTYQIFVRKRCWLAYLDGWNNR